MRLLNFLSGIAPVLLCLAAPTDATGGGNEPQPEAPTGDTPEAKYTSALKIIGDYFKQLSGAMREKDEAVGQVAGLTSRAEKAEKERDEFKGQLDSANSQISAKDSQIVGLTKERDDKQSKITLIESYCKHSNVDLAGLDKFQAAKTVPESQGTKDGKALFDEWMALKASGQGKKATAFSRKHKAELAEYAESLR